MGVSSEGSRYPTDVVYFKTAEGEGKVWHPAQKPVSLGRYLLRTFTQPGQMVLDHACGSGSFLIAAIHEGRNAIGIERNLATTQFHPRNVHLIDVCERRMRQAWADISPRTKALLSPSGLFAASS